MNVNRKIYRQCLEKINFLTTKIKKFRHNLQYVIWRFCTSSPKAKKYAKIAIKRGDIKSAFYFWNKALTKYPDDLECLNMVEFCQQLLNNKANFVNYNQQELILNKLQNLLDQKLYQDAIETWGKADIQNFISSARLYNISCDIFKNIIYNDLQFTNKETESKLIEFLCYQNISTVNFYSTASYSAICEILFRLMTSNKNEYEKFITYLNSFFRKHEIIIDKNIGSACLFISFNLTDKTSKISLMEKFFQDFFTYKQWSMILFIENTENIEIFQNLIQKKIDNIITKSPKEIFEYIYTTAGTHIPSYKKIITQIKNINFENIHTPFAKDIEYIAGKKDLYEECIKYFNLSSYKKYPFKTGGKKLKIAVCVSGQLRGYQQAMKSWKNFNTADHELTYFIHSWKYIGRKYPNPPSDGRSFSGKFLEEWRTAWFKIGEKEMNSRYKNIFALFSEENCVTENDLKKFYNTDYVVLEDDTSSKFENFSNAKKMYYKIYECHNMVKNSGKEFDLIIRIRPDKVLFIDENIDWNKIYEKLYKKDSIIVDHRPFLHPHSEYVIGDQVAIGNVEIMDKYAMTYKITEYAKKRTDLYGYPTNYIAHINFSLLTLYQNIDVEDMSFAHCGAIIDLGQLPINSILNALMQDVKNSKDPIDLALINAAIYDSKNSNKF